MFPKTNIEARLSKVRAKHFDENTWKDQVEAVFATDSRKSDQILKTIKEGTYSDSNDFTFDLLETNRIYHIDQIKKICVDYRLRFLDTKYFKGKIPNEALSIIKDLEKQHDTQLQGFKIMAPSKLFKLENADDPLLFAPIGNGYFYLIHKWGNDLNPFRKLFMWFFKSFENLIVLTFLVSLLATFLVPDGLFSKENSVSNFIMVFFFMFKSVAAVVLFYGFALGKNFNTAIWDSKYFNA
ncbi:hypothetical protein NBT05_13120 [Aquimarina sp. ERC-38]|uniref:hypothetical protein n=1 Tax=Aquimarina sp. ERC-38 TaxID=2949996 RepID=UPI0022461863|nr:hypothetical protein [Aquimarina sp. ERC-38]UZO79885.1 hypothetical protein NBT05_13120 [Aquimarina sp. ERC-38]